MNRYAPTCNALIYIGMVTSARPRPVGTVSSLWMRPISPLRRQTQDRRRCEQRLMPFGKLSSCDLLSCGHIALRVEGFEPARAVPSAPPAARAKPRRIEMK